MGPPCPCAGDPINLATGNEYHDEEDADLGALSFHRYYNSQVEVTAANLGTHWRHSFDRSLVYVSTGGVTTATVYRPNGQWVVFTENGTVWNADPDVPDTLVTTSTGWTYFEAATRNYENYNAAGQLVSIQDPNQLTTTLTYSTASTPTSIAPVAGLLLTVVDPRGRQLSFVYNSSGFVSTVTQPNGGVLTYSYSGNLLTQVTYPDRSTRQYSYTNTTWPEALTGVVDEASVQYVTLGYDTLGRAISSQLVGNLDSTALTFNSNGTTSVTYPLGAQTTLSFVTPNGSVHTSAVTAPCGPTCGQPNAAATFDSNGYLASTTDFNNNLTTTNYAASGLLDTQVDASGTSNQRTTNTMWNTTLRVPLQTTVANASGTTVANIEWVYNTAGQPLARCEIDPTNSAAAGYACINTGAVPSGVRRWSYTYCTAVNTQCPLVGLLLSVTGPRTDLTQTTSYSYYTSSSATSCGTPGAACHQAGDLYQVTNALSQVTTIASYDGNGRVTRVTDANGINADLTYTPRGWLASRTVDGSVTTLGYTAYGAVNSITDPDSVVTTFKYDGAHRLTDILDAQNNDLHYTLDAAGNETSEQIITSSGTTVQSQSRSYNALGQLTAIIDGLNKTVFNAGMSNSYDANGNLVLSADALGYQRQQGFDALNRLHSTIANYNGADPATQNTTTSASLDALDRLAGVTDPTNLATAYTFDGLNDRTQLQSPDTGTSTDTYDAAGDRLIHTDAKGNISNSTFDALDRMVGSSYPGDVTQNVTYNYEQSNTVTGCTASNPIGRLTSVVEATFSTIYCYDGRGNVIQKLYVTSNQTDITTYTYTSADRLSSYATPFVNFVNFSSNHPTKVSYTYDSNGHISSVLVLPTDPTSSITPVFGQQAPPPALGPATVVSNVSWMPFGPISSYTLGNGQTVQRTYDANYRLTDLVSPALNLHFALDAMGDIKALGNTPGANPATESYSYDPLYRLNGVTEGNGTTLESYTYDSTGDRLSKTTSGLAGGAYGYTPGTHQLISMGTATRANDLDGNTTGSVMGGSTYGFGYNTRNRMTVAQLNGSTVGTYKYNALGERVGKSATFPQSVSARYAYDEIGHLIGEYGTIDRDYVWLGDIPVAVVDDGAGSSGISTINYVTADQLGTPRAVSNGAGTVIWSWGYQGNPFGEQQPTSSAGYVLNLRYPGQYYDAETGTNYNMYRTYEPATGRYLQSDPIGLMGGISTYAYVSARPLDHSDMFGTQEVEMSGSKLNEKMQDLPDSKSDWWPASGLSYKNNICLELRCTKKGCNGTTAVYVITQWVPRNPTIEEASKSNPNCVCTRWYNN
ncbi:RHS repeat-associated core domain-containing protein [Dyella sp. S184]|uniref:RHS repeat-associated core domain-containing protein n=1 Tax=Dyella sp. S184 TaxID=1641862 RepID=UPI001C2038FC|nr:RHS repeat-associated core domain-containing protein [Dyella sp. S184]